MVDKYKYKTTHNCHVFKTELMTSNNFAHIVSDHYTSSILNRNNFSGWTKKTKGKIGLDLKIAQ